MNYGVGRGWLPHTSDAPFLPLWRAVSTLPASTADSIGGALFRYGHHWYQVGERHAASD